MTKTEKRFPQTEEKIYKVTLVDGPTTAIMPIKAYDEAHATRIARNMGLGRVVKVERIRRESIFKVTYKQARPVWHIEKPEFVKARDEAHALRIASRWGVVDKVEFTCEDNFN